MKLSADEIVTQRHKRAYIQMGGARPANPVRYGGQDGQYMKIEGVSAPESGGLNPIWVPDPRRVGKYRLVGRSIEPPDLADATLVLLEQHGSIPRQLGRMGRFNLYEATGRCKDLSDFTGGWSDYVLIYSGAIVTDKDLGDRMGWDSDDAIEDSLSITLADVYPVGALSFGAEADSLIAREVVDVVYGSRVQDGDCGPEDDGTKTVYALHQGNGTSTPANVIYSLDGGETWTAAAITGIGNAELPNAIDIVGRYLVVVSSTAASSTIGGYYVAELDNTGAPSAFTKVTAGFAANKQPFDLFVASPREVYFAAMSGTVYRASDILAGVTLIEDGSATEDDLYRIHGDGETIVAAGEDDIIVSRNRGQTWEAITVGAPGKGMTAVAVLDGQRYWVGDDTGELHYTLDGGATWTTVTLAGVAEVHDIIFPTDEVGYVAASTATPVARIFATWNGGADWTRSDPRLVGLPTFNRPNRLAAPLVSEADVAANNLAVAGVATGGTDGKLLLGVASRV